MPDTTEMIMASDRADSKAALVFVSFLSFLLILAVFAPRFLAYGPSLAGLILYLRQGFVARAWRPGNCHAVIAAIAFTILAAISSLWAVHPEDCLERAFKLASLLIPAALGFGAIRYLPPATLKRHLLLVPWAVIIALCLIFSELLLDMPLYKWLNGLKADEFFNSAAVNRAAVTCIACSFFALAILMQKKLYAEMGGIGLLILLVFALSQSQSAVLGILAGLPFFLLMPRNKTWVWKTLFLIVTALIMLSPLLGIFMLAFVDFIESSALSSFFSHSYAAERLEIWTFVSKHILMSPWLGYGIEATRNINDFETSQIFYRSTTVLHPHNFALQIWIEFGILGAMIACTALYGLLHKIRLYEKVSIIRAETATVIAMIAIAAVGYGMWQGWWLGLIILLFYFSALIRQSLVKQPAS
ncbi:MAG: O-antigen ligase family protein [Micavibrio sp.]